MLQIGSILGGYTIGREIGRGAMGVVYECEKEGARFALKILHTHLTKPELVKRFLQEVKALKKLSEDKGNPHIISYFDGGEENGTLFVVMELLEGVSLAQRLSGKTSSPKSAIRLIRDVADGVRHAHKQGIIHRDLKPDNIFLQRGVESGKVVKVLDFGIAKFKGGEGVKTATGAMFGTPQYMSLQAIYNSADVKESDDIFALGCILFEILTGKRLYPAGIDNLGEMIRSRQETPDLSEVTSPLQGVIYEATTMERENRYQTVDEFLAALTTAEEELGQTSHPTPVPAERLLTPVAPAVARAAAEVAVAATPAQPPPTPGTGTEVITPGKDGTLAAPPNPEAIETAPEPPPVPMPEPIQEARTEPEPLKFQRRKDPGIVEILDVEGLRGVVFFGIMLMIAIGVMYRTEQRRWPWEDRPRQSESTSIPRTTTTQPPASNQSQTTDAGAPADAGETERGRHGHSHGRCRRPREVDSQGSIPSPREWSGMNQERKDVVCAYLRCKRQTAGRYAEFCGNEGTTLPSPTESGLQPPSEPPSASHRQPPPPVDYPEALADELLLRSGWNRIPPDRLQTLCQSVWERRHPPDMPSACEPYLRGREGYEPPPRPRDRVQVAPIPVQEAPPLPPEPTVEPIPVQPARPYDPYRPITPLRH